MKVRFCTVCSKAATIISFVIPQQLKHHSIMPPNLTSSFSMSRYVCPYKGIITAIILKVYKCVS